MGFSLTSPAPEKGDPTAKNRVWGFFGDAAQSHRQNRPQTKQPRQGNRLTTTKIASGRTYWPSRDPIGERGGVNLYGFSYNSPRYWYDYLGLDPKPADPLAINPATGRPSPHLTEEQTEAAKKAWKKKYGDFQGEWTVEVCFYEDSFNQVKSKIREIAEGIASESNLPSGSNDPHEEGAWIVIKDGKVEVERWLRSKTSPHQITPTVPIPPNAISEIHSHPEGVPGENNEPTVANGWIPAGDTPGGSNGGPDAPFRPEHVSFVVDHKNIYWLYWSYECNSEGAVLRRRICMKTTPRKLSKKEGDKK